MATSVFLFKLIHLPREPSHVQTPSAHSDTTTIKEDDTKVAPKDDQEEVSEAKKDKKKKDLLFGCIPLHSIRAFLAQYSSPKGVEA